MEEHNQFSQTEEDEFRPTHISYREYKKSCRVTRVKV